MIKITDKQNCCGCSACAQACPKQCIVMTADEEGFLYPSVDISKCINCNLCEKVCNELNPYNTRTPLKVIAAINPDEAVRLNSSSGGIFHSLAKSTIDAGGVVIGARFDQNWQVVIDYAEDMKGVEAFMGSKYVQARIGNAYIEAKYFLEEGRKVLFSGTPCQVAGLNKFLRKQYENLLTVDIICHGTPSPKVWGKYLAETVTEINQISSIKFRNKSNGWKNFSFNLQYNSNDNTISLLSPFRDNLFMKAFLKDIILRPSCYNCKAKGCSSQSDITIADFWGIEKILPKMDDDKGTGMVLINTDKGEKSINGLQLHTKEVEYEAIKPLNPACYQSAKKHPKREWFFKNLEKKSVAKLTRHATRHTYRERLYLFKCKCKVRTKELLKGLRTCQYGGVRNKPNSAHISYIPNLELPYKWKISSIKFRNKNKGWRQYQIEIVLTGNL